MSVGPKNHAAHVVRTVGGDRADGFGSISIQEAGQSVPEGEYAQTLGKALFENPEAGLDPGLKRMDAQEARTEGMKCGHIGVLGIAREVTLAEVQKTGPHTLAQLAGGPLGESDREDPPRRDPILAHSPHEALDQDRGLAAAGAGSQQERSATPRDCLLLLVGRDARGLVLESQLLTKIAQRSQRQIVG